AGVQGGVPPATPGRVRRSGAHRGGWGRVARGSGPRRPGSTPGQEQAAASYAAVTCWGSPSGVVTVTVTSPASTAAARVANDWYAFAPGATSPTSFEPYGVASSIAAACSPVLSARTATNALPPRQRACAVTSTCGAGATPVASVAIANTWNRSSSGSVTDVRTLPSGIATGAVA